MWINKSHHGEWAVSFGSDALHASAVEQLISAYGQGGQNRKYGWRSRFNLPIIYVHDKSILTFLLLLQQET